MVAKKQWKELQDATLASVVKGIALNATVHYRVAKFHVGQLLYNRQTKEDGFISSVLADEGVITYEGTEGIQFMASGPLGFTLV